MNAGTKAIGVIVDVAHAAEMQTELQTLLPNCGQAHTALNVWETDGEGFLILIITLDATTPIGIYMADGPRSLRRQLTCAVKALRGARAAWFRGLDDSDLGITDRVFSECCERRWSAETLADVAIEGNA